MAVSLTDEEIEKVETAYNFDHGFPHTFLSGTLFKPESKPKQADKPGEVWHTDGQSGDQIFDWVEEPKPIRPSQ